MTRTFLTFLILLLTLNSFAQIEEIEFTNQANNKTSADSAYYFSKITWDNNSKISCALKKYLIADSTLVYEGKYSNFDSSINTGVAKSYNNQTGELAFEYVYDQLGREVIFKQYYNNGKLKRIENYKYEKNQSIIKKRNGKLYNIKGKRLPFSPYEVMPEYKGGETKLYKYLSKKIKYPKEAIANNTQGEVMVEFVVCEDGSVCNFEIIQPVSPAIDQEVLRVLKKMPKWKPGLQDGQAVKVIYTLPVYFSLGDNKEEL